MIDRTGQEKEAPEKQCEAERILSDNPSMEEQIDSDRRAANAATKVAPIVPQPKRLDAARRNNGDIKPCPFCGGSANLVQVEDQNGAVVECTGCHASGPLRIHAKDDANPQAIYSWNRRAEEKR